MARTQTAMQGYWVPVTAAQLAELCGQEQTVCVKSHGWISDAIRRGGNVYFKNQRNEKVSLKCGDQLFILE